MSLQRDAVRREEQVGQKTEWCSTSLGSSRSNGQASVRESWAGRLAVGEGSVCMGDRVAQEGKFFIHLSLAQAQLGASNGVPFVWDKHFVLFSKLRVKAKQIRRGRIFLENNKGEVIWTAVRVQFGMAV